MKEVKEQCEERIEEVTKKGNEAAASRDLSEQKDPSQQVTLGFSPKELPKVFLSSPRALSPICHLVCSCSLRHNRGL